MSKQFLDPHHKMFKPLWVRVLTAGLPIAWSVVEFTQGNLSWGFIFLAAGFYAGLTFWLARNQTPPEDQG